MPTFLSDPPTAAYFLLLILALIGAGVWLRRRDRRGLAVAGGAAALMFLLFGLSRVSESPFRPCRACVEDISAAINAGDWPRFEANLSDRFEFAGLNKAEFAKKVRDTAGRHRPRTVAWDFAAPDDLPPPAPGEFRLQFEGKAEALDKPFPAHFVATFVKDPDGRWRLKTFTPYNYISKRERIDVPGLPATPSR